MRNPKKPTFDQKRIIARAGLDWQSFLVKEETADTLVVIDKATNEVKSVDKRRKKK